MTNDIPEVLYRDALILVINKPPLVPVHAGFGKRTPLSLSELSFGLPQKPELAHRLDAATSGCLILGRQKKGLQLLSRLFQEKRISKTYQAVVLGCPKKEEGVIDLPLIKVSHYLHRSGQRFRYFVKADPNGEKAITTFKVEKCFGDYTVLTLSPITGRTHQLRVHCASMETPILGDFLYGDGDEASMSFSHSLHNENYIEQFLYLHATSVEIPLYKNKPSIKVSAPFPPHFDRFIKK